MVRVSSPLAVTLTVAGALLFAAPGFAPLAHAEALAAMPAATPSPDPVDDSRFSAIGHDADEGGGEGASSSSSARPVGAGVGITNQGHVTYMGARVDVPVSKRWSLIPQAALLRVGAIHPEDSATVNSYLGGGVGFHPSDGWTLEASMMYGPMSYGIGSVGGAFSVEREIGADWEHDVAPPVTLSVTTSATRFRWADGNGPAGADVTQGYLQAQALILATRRLQITPQGMLFVYDKTLDQARGERLGTVSALARIGSYAPRAMFGARVGYLISTWLLPFVDAQELIYASSIGSAQRLTGGARFTLARDAYVTALGGAIVNHVGGPLVAPDEDLRVVPVVGAEVEWVF